MPKLFKLVSNVFLLLLLTNAAYAQLSARFTANQTTGCAGLIVSFTDQSTGSPTSWLWDFGNGSTSVLQNPSITYINAGVYTVRLIVSNGTQRDTLTQTNYISISPQPVVNFVVSDSLPSCPPKSVTFTNLTNLNTSTGTYLWDFGDGNTSSSANPSHTYNSSGTFTVTLSATNSNNCNAVYTKTNYISVHQKPKANFTVTNSTSCSAPHQVTFTNTSTGATSYAWDFGDGNTSTSTNPSHTYNAGGNYTVRLIATSTNGCVDTMVMTNGIKISPIQFSVSDLPTSACIGQTISPTLTATPTGGTVRWILGNGQTASGLNPTFSYSTANTYTVQAIYDLGNGCKDTLSQNITITAAPVIAATASPTSACSAPLTVQFTNNTTGATAYLWDFGDGNTSTSSAPSHTYTAVGDYTVTLHAINSSGCTTTQVYTNMVRITPPRISITSPATACTGSSVTIGYTNPTHTISGNVNWDFGDGTTYSGSSTTKSYNSPGTYTITATFSTTAGCSGTVTKNITVANKPTAAFNIVKDSVCVGENVYLNSTTTGVGSYLWRSAAGDIWGNPRNIQFKDTGTFDITLIVSVNNACNDTLKKPITVIGVPVKFNVIIDCNNPKRVSVVPVDSSLTTMTWTMGDGQSYTHKGTVTHTYANYGTYNIKLVGYDARTGCMDSSTTSVRIDSLYADFSSADTLLCLGARALFKVTQAYTGATYIWNFGDGTNNVTRTRDTVTHAYNRTGVFNTTLIIRLANGCSDTIVKTNHIKVDSLWADFKDTTTFGTCGTYWMAFHNLSNGNGVNIDSMHWDFGDGTGSSALGDSIKHEYPASGTYTVTLTIKFANGCLVTKSKLVEVDYSGPNAAYNLSKTIACKGDTVHFFNQSTGIGIKYLWDFGDGNNSTSKDPSHFFNVPGSYDVRLITTDTNGCADTASIQTIHVPLVTSQFTASQKILPCPPSTVTFTNSSTNAASYSWDFGNGSTSSASSPTTMYTQTGSYPVTLLVTDVNGCTDSLRDTITVNGPLGSFVISPTLGCDSITVQFTATAIRTSSYTWDFDDGVVTTTNTPVISHTYTTPGMYKARLILNDGLNCTYIATTNDSILLDHLKIDITKSADSLCGQGTILFSGNTISTGSNVNTFWWQIGSNTFNTQTASNQYSQAGVYPITFAARNANGCVDTAYDTVVILPVPNLNIAYIDTQCVGSTQVMVASGGDTYTWSPGANLSCTNCATPTFTANANASYTVVAKNTVGCADTAYANVTVYNYPTLNMVVADTVVCEGTSVGFTVSGATDYSWIAGQGLSCVNCPNPVAKPITTNTYTVVGSNWQCRDTLHQEIEVLTKPSVIVQYKQTLCVGEQTQIRSTGATNYVWSPAIGLSCTTCADPIASPTTSQNYTVIGSLANGCRDTQYVNITVNPLPTIDAGRDTLICDYSTIQLQPSGGVNYEWSPGAGLSCTNCTSPIVSAPLLSTVYYVKGIDANGCSATDSVKISTLQRGVTSVSPADSICFGEYTTLTANGGESYLWQLDNGTSTRASVNVSPISSKDYTVFIKQNYCYTDTHYVHVEVLPTPTVDAGGERFVDAGSEIELSPNIGASPVPLHITWTPADELSCSDCPNPTLHPTSTTTYFIDVRNDYGCAARDSIRIIIECKDGQLFMPNTFTPNADGVNDWFFPMGKGIRIVKAFKIFNRWGELVFSRYNMQINDEYAGWNGTVNGVHVQPDVFVYYIEAECYTGENLFKKGDISIIR